MIVMVLIFSGRIGRNAGGGENGNNNNANINNNGGGRLEVILNTFIYWWRGHRVHTLVMASMIAFLFQVGLMSFFYQVLWVERGALLDAYLGRGQNNNDGGGVEGGGGRDGNENGNGAQQQATGGGGGGGAVEGGNNDRRPPLLNAGNLGNIIAGANPNNLAFPQVAGGGGGGAHHHHGLMRRGPNNGGFVHDIMCLVVSFLMSLIPAWEPDDWAEEEEQQQQQQEEEQQPAVEGAGDDNGNVGDNAE